MCFVRCPVAMWGVRGWSVQFWVWLWVAPVFMLQKSPNPPAQTDPLLVTYKSYFLWEQLPATCPVSHVYPVRPQFSVIRLPLADLSS